MPKASHPRQSEASRKRSSAYESPLSTCLNRIKKGNLSERSEFVSLPDLGAATTGTPQRGAANRGRLSLLTFFGEAKKVSGCRAAPGNHGRPKKEQHSSTHSRKVGTTAYEPTNAASNNSIQCLTGVSVPDCKCVRHTIFPDTIMSGCVACKLPSLLSRKR